MGAAEGGKSLTAIWRSSVNATSAMLLCAGDGGAGFPPRRLRD